MHAQAAGDGLEVVRGEEMVVHGVDDAVEQPFCRDAKRSTVEHALTSLVSVVHGEGEGHAPLPVLQHRAARLIASKHFALARSGRASAASSAPF
jgi:hypothetical protein